MKKKKKMEVIARHVPDASGDNMLYLNQPFAHCEDNAILSQTDTEAWGGGLSIALVHGPVCWIYATSVRLYGALLGRVVFART
jgi:hypothetical protein